MTKLKMTKTEIKADKIGQMTIMNWEERRHESPFSLSNPHHVAVMAFLHSMAFVALVLRTESKCHL